MTEKIVYPDGVYKVVQKSVVAESSSFDSILLGVKMSQLLKRECYKDKCHVVSIDNIVHKRFRSKTKGIFSHDFYSQIVKKKQGSDNI